MASIITRICKHLIAQYGKYFGKNEDDSPSDDIRNLYCNGDDHEFPLCVRRGLRTASRRNALSRRVVLQQMGMVRQHADHCGQGCQSQCVGGSSTPTPSTPSVQGVASIITEDLFNQLLKHKDDSACAAKGFYSYAAFIAVANAFSGFGTSGDLTANKRELAAFFAQTSHETTSNEYTSISNHFIP